MEIADSTTRNPISELPFVIDEFCVINSNNDYAAEHVKHRLNDALVIKRELGSNPPAGCVLEHTLTTRIDTKLSPNLGFVCENILQLRKSDESKVKRNVKRKLISCSKRSPTDGWRLNDREFNGIHDLYKFRDIVTLQF